MEKLIYDNWILQTYFTENYYPKEIVQLIILLEINLHQLNINCSCSHCFFNYDNKIYFHTATEKANIEATKLLLVYPNNKYENWELNCNDWLADLEEINQNQIIICDMNSDLNWIFANYKTIKKIELILGGNLYDNGVYFEKKDLDTVLKTLIDHNHTIIFAKCEIDLLYLIDIYFPTFHVHMQKILK